MNQHKNKRVHLKRITMLLWLMSFGSFIGAMQENLKRSLEEASENESVKKSRQDTKAKPLHIAASLGQVELIKSLVESGADVDEQDAKGMTPLHYAASNGHLEGITCLAQLGADLQALDGEFHGATPLHYAAKNGRIGAIECLAQFGALVNIPEEDDWLQESPLHWAAENNQILAIGTLVALGARLEEGTSNELTPLHFAAREGHVEAIQCLVELGAALQAHNDESDVPLHCAIEHGRVEAIRCLVRLGARLNARNNDGLMLLDLAIDREQIGAIRVLVELGVNLNALDVAAGCMTHLHFAAKRGRANALRCLIQLGAVIEARDAEGNTPLHLASNRGSVKCLIELGANLEAQNKLGWTPLHTAVNEGHLDAIKLLTQLGSKANTEAKNYERQTPLHLAAAQARIPAITCLHAANADLEAVDHEGRTALMIAAEAGHVEVIRYLVKRGALLEAKDPKGLTAINRLRVENMQNESMYRLYLMGADIAGFDQEFGGRAAIEIRETDQALKKAEQTELQMLFFKYIREKNSDLVKKLLTDSRSKSNGKEKIHVNEQDKDGNTALHRAIMAGSAGCVAVLLNHYKTDLRIKNKAGKTAKALAKDTKFSYLAGVIEVYEKKVALALGLYRCLARPTNPLPADVFSIILKMVLASEASEADRSIRLLSPQC